MTREIINDGSVDEKELVLNVKRVIDPELDVDVWSMGLIYSITIEDGFADIKMSLTSPNCPTAQTLPAWVESMVAQTEGVDETDIEIVWDPTWTPDMMTEAAQLAAGLF